MEIEINKYMHIMGKKYPDLMKKSIMTTFYEIMCRRLKTNGTKAKRQVLDINVISDMNDKNIIYLLM